MIEGLKEKEKSEYAGVAGETFDNWKGDKEQIDDVLMIGLLF